MIDQYELQGKYDIALGVCTDSYLLFDRRRKGPSATPILVDIYSLPPEIRNAAALRVESLEQWIFYVCLLEPNVTAVALTSVSGSSVMHHERKPVFIDDLGSAKPPPKCRRLWPS